MMSRALELARQPSASALQVLQRHCNAGGSTIWQEEGQSWLTSGIRSAKLTPQLAYSLCWLLSLLRRGKGENGSDQNLRPRHRKAAVYKSVTAREVLRLV